MSVYDSLAQIKQWPLSLWIADTPNVVPAIQTIHILGVGLFFPAGLLLALRFANLGLRNHSLTAVGDRFRPWMWLGMGLLLPTGLLLFLEDPANLSVNIAFRWKLALLVCGLVGLVLYERKRHALSAPLSGLNRRHAVAAISLLLVWSGVIGLGRFIAYLAYF